MFVSHLYVFFGEMSVLFSGPFFDWVIYFSGIELQEPLVFFEIDSLSVALFAIIFSQSEGCLFTLLIVSFTDNTSLYISLWTLMLLPCLGYYK